MTQLPLCDYCLTMLEPGDTRYIVNDADAQPCSVLCERCGLDFVEAMPECRVEDLRE